MPVLLLHGGTRREELEKCYVIKMEEEQIQNESNIVEIGDLKLVAVSEGVLGVGRGREET